MAYEIGDPNHIAVHEQLRTTLADMGAVTLPSSPSVGATGHVDDHQAVITALQEIADEWGVLDVPLPPVKSAGDLGHVNDHNSIDAAIAYLNSYGYNDATGGTVTTVYDYNGTGETWRVHRFDQPGNVSLTVSKALRPFRVLAVGGGYNGANCEGNANGGQGGAGGEVVDTDATLPTGLVPITVGGGQAATTVGPVTAAAGGGAAGGARGTYGEYGGPRWAGAQGLSSDISGTLTRYADGGDGGQGGNAFGGTGRYESGGLGGYGGGGYGAGNSGSGGKGGEPGGPGDPSTGSGGGGGGAGENAGYGGGGAAGIAYVAYQIATPVFNDATGGTVTDVADYNGTGETWRVHQFSASSTFTVLAAPEPFRVVALGGGGGGGGSGLYYTRGGAGGNGGAVENPTVTLAPGDVPVVVGGGGGPRGANTEDQWGDTGGTSIAAGVSAAGGQGGQSGNSYSYGNGQNGASGPAISSDISGADVPYPGAGYGGGGAGTDGGEGQSGGPGQAGRVVIAYRIS